MAKLYLALPLVLYLMTIDQSKQLLHKVFSQPFDNQSNIFINLARELLKNLDEGRDKQTYTGSYVWAPFREHIASIERLAQYRDPNDVAIDIVVVKVKEASTLDAARNRLRNVMTRYLHENERI